MDQEKIGKYLVMLRKKTGLSQEELSSKIGVTRQAISNWELGKVVPDNNSLRKLSNVFNVTVEEILNGENKINSRKNYKIIVIPIICFICVLIFLLLAIIYMHHSESYNINTETETIVIKDGIIVLKRDKLYFYLGKVFTKNNQKVQSISLFYKENNNDIIVYSCDSCEYNEISFNDSTNKNTYLEVKKIKKIINNMYVRINFDNNKYTIFKLNIGNSKHIEKETTGSSNIKTTMISNKKILELVNQKFEKEDDGYIFEKKYQDKRYIIIYLDNNLSIDVFEENIKESYNYNLLSGYLSYEKYKNNNSMDNQLIEVKTDDSNEIIIEFNKILEKVIKN